MGAHWSISEDGNGTRRGPCGVGEANKKDNDHQPEVTEEIIQAVENEVGMGCGAWDCVSPEEIILAAWKHKPKS